MAFLIQGIAHYECFYIDEEFEYEHCSNIEQATRLLKRLVQRLLDGTTKAAGLREFAANYYQHNGYSADEILEDDNSCEVYLKLLAPDDLSDALDDEYDEIFDTELLTVSVKYEYTEDRFSLGAVNKVIPNEIDDNQSKGLQAEEILEHLENCFHYLTSKVDPIHG